MLTGNEHQSYRFLEYCPVCHKSYDEHWKVVNHIRKTTDTSHQTFLSEQEQQFTEVYLKTKRQELHSALFDLQNIFSGTSFAHTSKIVHRKLDKHERENHRRDRISNTMSETIKTDEHNENVSLGVSKAWEDGKFDTEAVKEARRKGYAKRPSVAGAGNPMYGKPCPKGAGRGKGGIRTDIGHYVRSTWEANICRVCNVLNRKYEYEPTRFKVTVDGENYTYCPDIYFPDKGWYYEIKGHARASNRWICDCKHCMKNRKIIEAVRLEHEIKIIVIGRDEYRRFMRKFSKRVNTWEK